MQFRIHLPADFRWWRVGCVLLSLCLMLLGLWLLNRVDGSGGFAGTAGALIICVATLVGSSIPLVMGTSGLWSRPFGRIFGNLFYPEETITEPPEALLRSLRTRLRDRQWESVTQQIDALTQAYGNSADLFYLRAHLVAGQTGSYRTVTAAAVTKLSARAFDRYAALLRRDPPPETAQTGIDA